MLAAIRRNEVQPSWSLPTLNSIVTRILFPLSDLMQTRIIVVGQYLGQGCRLLHFYIALLWNTRGWLYFVSAIQEGISQT